MKKIFIAAIVFTIFSCTSGDKTTIEGTKNSNQVGVPNVNGNVPDTTNAINLSTLKNDTTVRSKDSMR